MNIDRISETCLSGNSQKQAKMNWIDLEINSRMTWRTMWWQAIRRVQARNHSIESVEFPWIYSAYFRNQSDKFTFVCSLKIFVMTIYEKSPNNNWFHQIEYICMNLICILFLYFQNKWGSTNGVWAIIDSMNRLFIYFRNQIRKFTYFWFIRAAIGNL